MRKKKNKNTSPYPKSFAKRLTWRIMLRMLIIMGIPSFLIFFVGYGTVYLGADIVCKKVLKGEYEEVRRIMSDVYVAAVNTAPVIEENLDRPDRMYDIVERMLTTNPRIHSCGISFIADYYPKKGRWFFPYAMRRDSSAVETLALGDSEHDYLNEGWFKESVSKQVGIWSNPYFDRKEHQTPLVSYLLPIRDRQNRTVAVLGVDMSLDWLEGRIQLKRNHTSYKKDTTEQWSSWLQSYYFMVDTSGTFLVHPDRKRIINEKLQTYLDEDPDSIGSKMMSLQDGDGEEMVLDDEKVFVCYQPVKYSNWSMGFVTPMLFIDIFGYVLGGFLILLIVMGLLVVYIFGRRTIKRAVKPVKQLAASADEVAKGNFHAQLPEVKSRDEIHQLRDSFEQMQYSLVKYVEELQRTTAQKASFESELKVANTIQMSMLPKTFPPYPERQDIDIFGRLTPAKAVGGDLFDFYIRDEKLFFCIGDVSGKGVPASLVMAVTRSLFRNVSNHETLPNHIMMALNDSMVDGNEMNMFVTLFVGVLDLATGMLRYCNAGHDSPLLIGQQMGMLACDSNLPIGVMPDWQYTLQEKLIVPQTTIFLFTDGLNEAEASNHAQFGDQRVLATAQDLLAKGMCQPMNVIDQMTAAVHNFVGDAEQSDDLTMLAIQYKKVRE